MLPWVLVHAVLQQATVGLPHSKSMPGAQSSLHNLLPCESVAQDWSVPVQATSTSQPWPAAPSVGVQT